MRRSADRGRLEAPFRDEALSWAADVGVRLAEEGDVGLAAWHHALRRPEVKRWFPSVRLRAEEREALPRALGWALRFPGVYTVSEGPNRLVLPVGGRQAANDLDRDSGGAL